jgi:hypothetical protein
MMKLLFSLLLITAPLFTAKAEEVALGSFGKLAVDHPANWTMVVRETRDGAWTITLEPKAGNARCVMRLELMKTPIPIDREKIKTAVLRACEKPMAGSVEKKKNLKEMDLQQGYGVYCAFRDAELVGKPVMKGDFKTFSIGKCQLTETVGAVVNVLSDELDGDDSIVMWQILRSMHVVAASPAK